jgi:hypothetical protein
MPVKTFIKLFAVLILSASFIRTNAQFFAYVEAEGQQPFYLRIGQKLYSSNASGFLILPRLDGAEVAIKVGFPENLYPEVAFNMTAAARDRGFLLKLVDGSGWTMIEKGSASAVTGQVIGLSSEANAGKDSIPLVPSTSVPATSSNAEIEKKLLGEKSGQLEMIFFEKHVSGKIDTIYVQIPKLVEEPHAAVDAMVTAMPVKSGCKGTPADVRDVRNLQKKLLGISVEEDQLALVVKAFTEKCFSCKQALEVAWFFVSEPARLKLFRQLYTLVADPVRFPDLEEAFLSDDGIAAFREMLGLKY